MLTVVPGSDQRTIGTVASLLGYSSVVSMALMGGWWSLGVAMGMAR